MAKARTIKMGAWKTLAYNTAGGAGIFIPVTSFMSAAGLDEIRANIEMRGFYGSAQIVPAFQTCGSNPQAPDAAVAVLVTGGAAGWANADGVFDYAAPVALAISTKTLVRFGYLIKLGAGTNGGGTVRGSVQVYSD